MAVREITYCGEAVLRRNTKKVLTIDDEVIRLVNDMRETMGPAAGMGLAAPQVGISSRVVTMWTDSEGEEITALINPRIVEQEGEEKSYEGCLSLPTLRGIVMRPSRVVVEAIDLEGEEFVMEGEGIMAHCIAHELDHLSGKLFIDRVDPASLVWMRPDEREESGVRYDPTTMDEAVEAFKRLIDQKRQRGDS